MAYDRVVDSAQLDAGIARVADAVRAKGGTAAKLTWPQGLVDAIKAIPANETGAFEKIMVSEWTPETDTRDYPLARKDVKYCIISDKSVNGRPNSAVVSLVMTNAEFFAGFKPITELKTGFQGSLEQTINYYGKDVRATSITASVNFVAGRTYDVIAVY